METLVANCPGCGTMETLWFHTHKVNGEVVYTLTTTSRFYQKGKKVYHNCGLTTSPCKLFQSWGVPSSSKTKP